VTVPALAVRLAVCTVETADTLAVNWAVVAFAATRDADGTVTATLLLDKATLKPPVGAAPLIVTVQRSVPVPPIDALAQEILVSCGVVTAAAAPVPLRLITVAVVEALLLMAT
jgi:hypothetical protein